MKKSRQLDMHTQHSFKEENRVTKTLRKVKNKQPNPPTNQLLQKFISERKR